MKNKNLNKHIKNYVLWPDLKQAGQDRQNLEIAAINCISPDFYWPLLDNLEITTNYQLKHIVAIGGYL